ncbi:CD209 antigen-like protein C isoform X2 [Cebidichthys violaceus]|uniref:CD209 antigen-like protein C isoform X2 n=1 Tax=Cebidichthys violaceus TaxID=271503 RepID=UPI0035CCA8CA
MEEIYLNVKYDKSEVSSRPSRSHTGPRSSENRSHGAVVLSLGLLSVFLLAGLIGLFVHYLHSVRRSAAELSALKADLTEERDRLKRPCPAGWRMFSCACYLISEESGSWDKGRLDCRDRGADLVVISSTDEQRFLSNFTETETPAWIGLTDRVQEKTWMWIDGARLSLKFWRKTQPDNGGGHGELWDEDCAHITSGEKSSKNWSDLSCGVSLRWICEKKL